MLTLLFDRSHRVLMARFTGIFSSEDVAATDNGLIRFLSRAERADELRCIYNYHEIEAMAVPRSRLIERSVQPPIIRSTRVLVAYPNAPDDFGQIFRLTQLQQFKASIEIVWSPEDAYRLLRIDRPAFEPVQDG